MKLSWELRHGPNKASPQNQIAFALQRQVKQIVSKQKSHVADMYPFYDDRFSFAGHVSAKWIAVRIQENRDSERLLFFCMTIRFIK